MPKTKVRVKLQVQDVRDRRFLRKVYRALREDGFNELAEEYLAEGSVGNYEHVLLTTIKYVTLF